MEVDGDGGSGRRQREHGAWRLTLSCARATQRGQCSGTCSRVAVHEAVAFLTAENSSSLCFTSTTVLLSSCLVASVGMRLGDSVAGCMSSAQYAQT
jgi:hypothetical protein